MQSSKIIIWGIFRLFLFWRLGLLIITYLGSLTFPLIANRGLGAIDTTRQFDFWASWAQWDGGHYYDIAKNGYSALEDFAFFPLYPFLIKIISLITSLDILFLGLLISNLAFLFFLYLLNNLTKVRFNQKIAATTTITFLLFPTTFFTVAFYSESVFLLIVAVVFLTLWQKKYLLASVAISLASLTRALGVFLIISAVYSYLSHVNSKILHLVPSVFGIAIYMIYLAATTNDPLKFLNVQGFWQRTITDPISTVASYLWSLFTMQARPINDWLDLGFTLLFLTVLILGARKIPSSLWIFSMLTILVPASSGTLTSMPRYLLSSLGAFIVIGQFLADKPRLKITVWTLSLLLQILFAVRFINGYWVA